MPHDLVEMYDLDSVELDLNRRESPCDLAGHVSYLLQGCKQNGGALG